MYFDDSIFFVLQFFRCVLRGFVVKKDTEYTVVDSYLLTKQQLEELAITCRKLQDSDNLGRYEFLLGLHKNYNKELLLYWCSVQENPIDIKLVLDHRNLACDIAAAILGVVHKIA